MFRIVILGAGPAGAATALFLARRGHSVTVIDRDPVWLPLSPTPGSRVPHVRQGHSFLALGTHVLSTEAPDIVDDVIAAGGLRVPLPHDTSHWNLLSRRQLLDAVLRRRLSEEPGVCFLPDTTATGLLVTRGETGAHVAAVTTREFEIPADVVIDACGCHSPMARWLAAHRLALKTFLDPSHFFYLTRHYRLRHPADSFPSVRIPIIAAMDYASALAFPEDNGHFQLTVQLVRSDPSSRALRDPVTFDRFLSAVPLMAPWLAIGEPTGDPEIVGTVGNGRRQTFFHKPIVTGLLLVGDAAFYTNPSAARGVAIGLAHAQALAKVLHAAHEHEWTPATLTETWERTTSQLVDTHLDNQVRIDRQRVVQIRSSIDGRLWESDNDTHRLAQVLMDFRDCETVGAAADRVFNLLSTPQAFYADPKLMRRVVRLIRSGAPARVAAGPSRQEYERLVARQTPRTH